jgi:hypothetical protein
MTLTAYHDRAAQREAKHCCTAKCVLHHQNHQLAHTVNKYTLTCRLLCDVPVLLSGESPLSNRRTTVAILATSSCPSLDATALLLQAAAHSFVSARVCAPLQYSLHDKVSMCACIMISTNQSDYIQHQCNNSSSYNMLEAARE